MNQLVNARPSTRRLPEHAVGVADARVLPDADFAFGWSSIILPNDTKEKMLRVAVAGAQLRATVPFDAVPLHGVILLTGQPGVGKTTVARGLADKMSRTVTGHEWLFIEVDPHALASASLGRSQRSVEQLFGVLLEEQAAGGPMVVLLDEVETLFTERSALSMDANPIDVHRAVDAALVGLDRLARKHPNVLIIATSNFRGAIDAALTSRADAVFEIPLPDRDARRAILGQATAAVAAAFPGAGRLTDPRVLDRAADLSDGIDGRQLRKSVVVACAHNPAAHGNPDAVTGDDLIAALTEIGGRS
jgi:pachytene checkpoint protein 2